MNATKYIEDASISAYVKMTQAVEAVRRFKMDERGVTAVEYAIVLAGVAGVVAIIFGKDGTVSTMLKGIFTTIQTNVTSNLPTNNTPAP